MGGFSLLGWKNYPVAMMIRLQLYHNNLAQAEAIMDTYNVNSISKGTISFDNMWIALAQCELLLAQQNYQPAYNMADKLVSRFRQVGITLFVPDILYVKALALLAQNRTAEAYKTLLEARTEAEAIESRRNLWPILHTLSQVEAQRGHGAEAEAFQQQTQEIITYIANHTPPDLRNLFLALPRVLEVMQ